jgi:hypothetical protein
VEETWQREGFGGYGRVRSRTWRSLKRASGYETRRYIRCTLLSLLQRRNILPFHQNTKPIELQSRMSAAFVKAGRMNLLFVSPNFTHTKASCNLPLSNTRPRNELAEAINPKILVNRNSDHQRSNNTLVRANPISTSYARQSRDLYVKPTTTVTSYGRFRR